MRNSKEKHVDKDSTPNTVREHIPAYWVYDVIDSEYEIYEIHSANGALISWQRKQPKNLPSKTQWLVAQQQQPRGPEGPEELSTLLAGAPTPTMRTFETGATRDVDVNKLDFEGFFSPLVLERYAQYMHKNRKQADGSMRDSDNWQKGIPIQSYMKSMWRHFFDVWKAYRGHKTAATLEDNLLALLFNVQGMLHERLTVRTGTPDDQQLKARYPELFVPIGGTD